MKPLHLLVCILAATAAAGCSSPTRSRNLPDAKVSAVTLAQQVCSNCHGITGNSVSPNFPNLAAQQSNYLAAQLKVFKSHDRKDPAGFEYMWGLSRFLTDEQINGLAAYYSSQKLKPLPPESDPARVAAGKTIFHEGVPGKNIPACATCHGQSGQGNDTFPRLAGQHADYVAKQLEVFQRTNQRPEGAIMTTVAHELSKDEILNAAAYVQQMRLP